MWIAHLPLACSLQGYHGVIHDNLAGSDWGMAQAGNRAGKTQPCMQMAFEQVRPERQRRLFSRAQDSLTKIGSGILSKFSSDC